jgi:cell division septation protein DedD
VEFGPFYAAAEAEQTERKLNLAGHPTVRFRQQGGALYAVLIERLPTARDAQALVAVLREQGFPEAVVLGGGDTLNVRVGEPTALHPAVQLAERLRGRGHHVRVAAQPGEAITFIIRHGNFASRAEAEARSEELARLGLTNHVVRVR